MHAAVVLRVACLLVEGLLVGAKMTKRCFHYSCLSALPLMA